MSAKQPQPDPLGYEEARQQLADTVAALEAGDTTLEEALALWERGEQLSRACTEWLDGAQARLDGTTSPEEPAD